MSNLEHIVLPKIGRRGKYTLILPWKCDDDTIHTCTRIYTFKDAMITDNINVLQDIYKENGLTEEDYIEANDNDVPLITISDDYGITITLPATHLAAYPDLGYVPYHRVIISADLGLLPHDIGLENILKTIQSGIEEKLNVHTTPVSHHEISDTYISYNEYLEMETKRKSGIIPYTPDWARIQFLQERNRALSDAVKELEGLAFSQ